MAWNQRLKSLCSVSEHLIAGMYIFSIPAKTHRFSSYLILLLLATMLTPLRAKHTATFISKINNTKTF